MRLFMCDRESRNYTFIKQEYNPIYLKLCFSSCGRGRWWWLRGLFCAL